MKFLLQISFFLLTLNLSAQSGQIPIGNSPIKGADTLSPLHIVQNYVSPNGFPGKMKFFCCEMYKEWYADSTLGQHLPARVQRDCKIVFQDTAHAVISAWLHDTITSRDVYFYLVKNQCWTIYAVRSLVMTDETAKEMARLDSIPEKDRGKVYMQTHSTTFAFEFNNLRLWGSSDTLLALNFYSTQKKFYQLQKLLVKKKYTSNDTLLHSSLKNKKVKKLTDELLIRNIEYDKRYPGCVFYIIGGQVDNTVGYLYQPDPKKIPHVTEKHYIYLHSLGNGWYVFKTT